MHILSLDMYQTLALAVGVQYLGMFLKKRIRFLEKFCIPSPVIGGLIFALLSLGLYCTGIVEFVFDETLKTVCMVIFFTSVGFQANLRILKSGGVSLVIFLVCVIVLILGQNFLSVGLAKVMGPNAPEVPCPPTMGIEPVQRPISESSHRFDTHGRRTRNFRRVRSCP